MNISDGFIGAIGNTPLVRLNGPSEETGCDILGKIHFTFEIFINQNAI